MEINNVSDKYIERAIEYAIHVLPESQKIMDFAIAMVDYMGEDFIPACKVLYGELYKDFACSPLSLTPSTAFAVV